MEPMINGSESSNASRSFDSRETESIDELRVQSNLIVLVSIPLTAIVILKKTRLWSGSLALVSRDEEKHSWDYNDATLSCQAFLQGIYGRKYVWILPGWYSDRWWENRADTSCSKHDIKLAAGNYLATRPIPVGDATTPTIAGKVSNSFPPLEVECNGLRYRVRLNWA